MKKGVFVPRFQYCYTGDILRFRHSIGFTLRPSAGGRPFGCRDPGRRRVPPLHPQSLGLRSAPRIVPRLRCDACISSRIKTSRGGVVAAHPSSTSSLPHRYPEKRRCDKRRGTAVSARRQRRSKVLKLFSRRLRLESEFL